MSIEPGPTPGGDEDGGAGAAGGSADGGAGDDSKLLAKKYKTPEALEIGYEHLLTEHTRTAEDRDRVREENETLRRQLDEAQQRQAGPTPTPVASGNQDPLALATKAWQEGRFLDANRILVEAGKEELRKELGGQFRGLETQMHAQTAEAAITTMQTDKKAYPHLNALNKEMSTKAESRIKGSPGIVKAYGGWRNFFRSLYLETVGEHPELQGAGRAGAAAAAIAGGGGASPRTSRTGALSAASPSNESDPAKAKVRRALGFPVNPYQGDRSTVDQALAEEFAQLEALERQLAAGAGVE